MGGGVAADHKDSPCRAAFGNCAGTSFGTTDAWDSAVTDSHATSLLGVIGARDNKRGVVGMNAKTKTNICYLFARVYSEDSELARESDIMAAVEWATGQAVDVIFLPVSGSEPFLLDEMLDAAGVAGAIIVAGSGNGAEEYPAKYPSVLSVGAVDENK